MLNRILQKRNQKNEMSKSSEFRLLAYLLDGNEPAEADPQLIAAVFNEKTNPEAYKHGAVILHNYMFDYKEFLTEFLVHTQDKGWNKVFAISVEWVTRNSANPELITEIRKITH